MKKISRTSGVYSNSLELKKARKILIGIDRDGTLIHNDDFFGSRDTWINEIKFNKKVLRFLSFIQKNHNVTTIVLTNQAGVARGFFSSARAEEINSHISSVLKAQGITIDTWQYCPFVDVQYVSQHPEWTFDQSFIQAKTKRKPSPAMLIDGLTQLHLRLREFDKIFIMGDRDEDRDLARNLNANFIHVKGKRYQELIDIFMTMLSP